MNAYEYSKSLFGRANTLPSMWLGCITSLESMIVTNEKRLALHLHSALSDREINKELTPDNSSCSVS
jgi:hypothetical protein